MTTSDVVTRHGPMRIINEDVWISRCLRETGEHSESELNLMRLVLGLMTRGRYDATVVDGGAFIGDHTIPLSRMCKRVYAFEPQAETREILEHNLRINGCTNVEVMPYALGDVNCIVRYRSEWRDAGTDAASPGGTQMGIEDGDCEAQMVSLDELGLDVDFVKADIEGMEIPALSGMMQTLARCRPALFMEFDTVIQSLMRPLPECLDLVGYRGYPMQFPMWSPDNFNQAPNTFGQTVAKMMLAVPAQNRELGVVCGA